MKIRTLTVGQVGRWTVLALSLNMLSACAPLVLGSALGGAFMASDRRTSGTQIEDSSIEFKAAARIRDNVATLGHVNVNAYNRMVLLTGEVPSEEDRVAAEKAASQVENVQSVVNELAVMGNSSLGSRSSDVLINGKVKASLVDARDLFANAFDIVVERGDVYLMGLVTEREANRAAEVAAGVSGVRKVVKIFHPMTEDELARKLPPPQSAASASAAASTP
jgi:osmotically-inducible protein OsmY